jgi:predicted transcriptional regulator
MPSLTVRIDEASRQTLRELSERRGESMQEILARAIEEYRRRHFLESANNAFAALQKQPKAWKQEQEERRAWDRTLRDGQRK